jgi:uncharacterized membrane protein YeiH
VLFRVIDLLGVAVFAISGALAAGRKRLDLLGVAVVALATAIGGGTIRDLLLNRHPVFWIADPTALYVILSATSVMLVYVRWFTPPQKSLLVADGIGLAFYTIVGARIAEKAEVSAIVVVLMGTISGVGGGVIRDVLLNEVPLILRKGTIYATAAIAGALVYVGIQFVGMPRPAAAVAGMATIATMRFAAILFGLTLPIFEVPEEPRAKAN